MTPQQLEVLAILYDAYGEGDFVFRGRQGSAVQTMYEQYGNSRFRQWLGKGTTWTNFKGEFVLHNVLQNTHFVTKLRQDVRNGKKLQYYRLSGEGVNVGRLICTGEEGNIKAALQICKKYNGEAEELPASYYK